MVLNDCIADKQTIKSVHQKLVDAQNLSK